MSNYIWLGFKGRTFPAHCTSESEQYYLLWYFNENIIYSVSRQEVMKFQHHCDVQRYIAEGVWTEVVPEQWAVESKNYYFQNCEIN